MNKIELEKMFDYNYWHDNEDLSSIKEFIFETIIPEVLKSVINWTDTFIHRWNRQIVLDANTFEYDLKQKAKEQFWIDL